MTKCQPLIDTEAGLTKDGVDLFYSSSFWAYAKENTPTALVTCSQCTCIEDWNITMSSFSIFNLCSMERRSLRVCTVLGNCSEAFSVRQQGRSSDCLHHFTSDAKNLKWDIPEENVQEAVHLHSAFVFALVLKVWQYVPKRPQELSASLNTLWTRTCSQTIISGARTNSSCESSPPPSTSRMAKISCQQVCSGCSVCKSNVCEFVLAKCRN